MRQLHRTSIALLALLLLGCSPLLRGKGSRRAHLDKAADKILSASSFRGASWSIMAVDLQDGRILMTRDEDRSLVPASNIKLLGTACALETLGPDYRIATTIGYTGRLEPGGVLNGDLIVIGAGDPTMSSRFLDSTDTFSAWCDTLQSRNIRHINGDLIGYIGLFKGDPLGAGWEWDDLPEWFAAEFCPLTYSDGCIEIIVTPADSVGRPAQVHWGPAGDYATVSGTVSTVAVGDPSEISFDRDLASNQITLWGTVAQGSEPQHRWVTVHHPADLFLKTFERKLRQNGITLTGTTRASSSWQPSLASFNLIFLDLAPPLRDILRIINQHSHNLYAEMLVRALGVRYQAADLWGLNAKDDALSAGRDAIRQWEASLVGPSTGFVMVDGSGLSRRNLACASEMIKVLVHMNRSPHRWEFVNSLATPGVGTLKGRFRGLPQGVTLNAKTGTLARVKALSGYIGLEGYPRIALSIICNNYLCSTEDVDSAFENLCQILALYLKEE